MDTAAARRQAQANAIDAAQQAARLAQQYALPTQAGPTGQHLVIDLPAVGDVLALAAAYRVRPTWITPAWVAAVITTPTGGSIAFTASEQTGVVR